MGCGAQVLTADIDRPLGTHIMTSAMSAAAAAVVDAATPLTVEDILMPGDCTKDFMTYGDNKLDSAPTRVNATSNATAILKNGIQRPNNNLSATVDPTDIHHTITDNLHAGGDGSDLSPKTSTVETSSEVEASANGRRRRRRRGRQPQQRDSCTKIINMANKTTNLLCTLPIRSPDQLATCSTETGNGGTIHRKLDDDNNASVEAPRVNDISTDQKLDWRAMYF